jgi:MFS family permease
MDETKVKDEKKDKKRVSLQFILLLGIVSLFGDITYEGARSVAGPYLASLGASALAVGFVGGIGEFLGYALRLVSGFVADRTKAYWPLTIIGYGLLCAIPLMATANNWALAALFLILERAGKGIRAPARDAILSHATKQVGRGLGFGIHEAVDQIGAFIGPLLFSAAAFYKGGYREGFIILSIPAILCLVTLFIGRVKVPAPVEMEEGDSQERSEADGGLPRAFWVYGLFSFLAVAGLVNFQIISFHLKVQSVISDAQIPLLYAFAMGMDALCGLLFGRIYDKVGLISLAAVPLLTIPIPITALSFSPYLAIISMVLWGAVMGVHETIMRAAVADITSISKRGRAYGIFNTFYGGAFLAGSAATGWLYEYSLTAIVLFTLVLEGAALIIILRWRKDL